MTPRLHRLHVQNFRSLRDVTLQLGSLNVLVGPNGAGKSTVLDVLSLLQSVAGQDLAATLRMTWPRLFGRAREQRAESFTVLLEGAWSDIQPRNLDDTYELRVVRNGDAWARTEHFLTDTGDAPTALSLQEDRLTAIDGTVIDPPETHPQLGIDRHTSGLSIIPKLSGQFGESAVTRLSQTLKTIRFLDDVAVSVFQLGRNPHELGTPVQLNPRADNLAAFLLTLREHHPERFNQLESDATEVLPQLAGLAFEFPSGAGSEVIVALRERGLSGTTELADASHGTVRLLTLLAVLHDPNPSAFTCIEDIENGLHPQALELLALRLREASQNTQFFIASHSPTFVDRLQPEEIIVCERRGDGSSAIPVITTEQIREIVDNSENEPLGRLWFSGALGGDL